MTPRAPSFNIFRRTREFDRLLGRVLDGESHALDEHNNVLFYNASETTLGFPFVTHRSAYNADSVAYVRVTMKPGFTFEERVWEAARTVAERFGA